jgi:hypothetical protein
MTATEKGNEESQQSMGTLAIIWQHFQISLVSSPPILIYHLFPEQYGVQMSPTATHISMEAAHCNQRSPNRRPQRNQH